MKPYNQIESQNKRTIQQAQSMKARVAKITGFFLLSCICVSVLAQGTAFTYQGRLNDGANPASGQYDLVFTLFATDSSGDAVAGPVTNAAVAVSNGLFTTAVDFGNVFTGASNWLEITVSPGGSNTFTTLVPRQQLTPVPYALVAANVSGPIAASALPDVVVTNNANGLTLGGAFSGDGSGLSSVNAYSVNGLTTDSLWKVGGNAGASPTNGAFLGTTDSLPLEFKVNGQRALRLEYGYYSFPSNAVPNVIGGCSGNVVSNGFIGAFIGGGGVGSDPNSDANRVGGNFSSVLGGLANTAFGDFSTAMGIGSTASAVGATAMGAYTKARGANSTAMGNGATASGNVSTAMGNLTIASGTYSTAMGDYSSATGDNSVAMGFRARASGDGSFVWNSFPAASLPENANQFGVYGPHGLNVDYYDQRPDGGGLRWFYIGDLHAGDTIATWSGAHLTDGGVWANASDRNRKTDFIEVDPQSVLAKLASLPVREWRYTNEISSVRHLGPTAQDFQAAFHLGTDDKSIGTVDESGVALAAIQGLNQKLEEQRAENAALKERLAELERLVASKISGH
jgi:trimeric autotransporter adhesin